MKWTLAAASALFILTTGSVSAQCGCYGWVEPEQQVLYYAPSYQSVLPAYYQHDYTPRYYRSNARYSPPVHKPYSQCLFSHGFKVCKQ